MLDPWITGTIEAMYVLATIAWGSLLAGALVGAVISTAFAVVATSTVQPWVDRRVFLMRTVLTRRKATPADASGVWRSRYVYTSGDRPEVPLIDEHFVVLIERRGHVRGRSLSRPGASDIVLALDLEGGFLSGSWREDASERLYHGVCQFQISPTLDGMHGGWAGFSRTRGVQTGAWTLTLEARDTGRRTRKRYTGRLDLAWRKPVAEIAP
jgi:hypothetical protein